MLNNIFKKTLLIVVLVNNSLSISYLELKTVLKNCDQKSKSLSQWMTANNVQINNERTVIDFGPSTIRMVDDIETKDLEIVWMSKTFIDNPITLENWAFNERELSHQDAATKQNNASLPPFTQFLNFDDYWKDKKDVLESIPVKDRFQDTYYLKKGGFSCFVAKDTKFPGYGNIYTLFHNSGELLSTALEKHSTPSSFLYKVDLMIDVAYGLYKLHFKGNTVNSVHPGNFSLLLNPSENEVDLKDEGEEESQSIFSFLPILNPFNNVFVNPVDEMYVRNYKGFASLLVMALNPKMLEKHIGSHGLINPNKGCTDYYLWDLFTDNYCIYFESLTQQIYNTETKGLDWLSMIDELKKAMMTLDKGSNSNLMQFTESSGNLTEEERYQQSLQMIRPYSFIALDKFNLANEYAKIDHWKRLPITNYVSMSHRSNENIEKELINSTHGASEIRII